MPVTVSDVTALQAYMRAVVAAAKHHAKNVEGIVLALAGAVIARKDDDAPLEVHSGKGGGLGQAITVTIKKERYAFSYDHENGCIQMKRGSFQGPVIHRFTDDMPVSEVARIFKDLAT